MLSSPSPKQCLRCGKEFTPKYTSMQVACSVVCARRYATSERKGREGAEKAKQRERKQALKRIPDLIKEAQIAFNAFVRERDKNKPCICCGEPLGKGEVGGAYDCGHYRSRGSAPHLRFDERNAHAQRKYCNRHGAGRAVDYRVGLVARIGLAAVEALEADNSVKKWQRDELVAIKETYRQKLKELRREA